ncbi:MAG: Hpt domain [Pseudomonadota bacterium]
MKEPCDTPAAELPVLDLQHLSNLELLSNADESFVGELSALFRQSTPAYIAQLCSAAEKNDREIVRSLAHRLKGSAANIGARRMAEYCSTLELKAKTTTQTISPDCCMQLEQEFKACEQQLLSWLRHNDN